MRCSSCTRQEMVDILYIFMYTRILTVRGRGRVVLRKHVMRYIKDKRARGFIYWLPTSLASITVVVCLLNLLRSSFTSDHNGQRKTREIVMRKKHTTGYFPWVTQGLTTTSSNLVAT